MFPGKHYDETKVGETFSSSLTVTETHLVMASGLFGDFNPLHVDEAFAARSRYGGRILHGVITSALVGAEFGMVYAGTAIGYLEHAARFLAPVKIGDELTITWTVTALDPKPKHGGGIVTAEAMAVNQDGVTVCTARGRMLVGDAPAA